MYFQKKKKKKKKKKKNTLCADDRNLLNNARIPTKQPPKCSPPSCEHSGTTATPPLPLLVTQTGDFVRSPTTIT
jgi:hypothetical protein